MAARQGQRPKRRAVSPAARPLKRQRRPSTTPARTPEADAAAASSESVPASAKLSPARRHTIRASPTEAPRPLSSPLVAGASHQYTPIHRSVWCRTEFSTPKQLFRAYGVPLTGLCKAVPPLASLEAYTAGDLRLFRLLDVPVAGRLLRHAPHLEHLALVPLDLAGRQAMSYRAVMEAKGWEPAVGEEAFPWVQQEHEAAAQAATPLQERLQLEFRSKRKRPPRREYRGTRFRPRPPPPEPKELAARSWVAYWAALPGKRSAGPPPVAWHVPCHHPDVPCTPLSCRCIATFNWCTPQCVAPQPNPNRFAGCQCRAGCVKACPCAIAKRECDPEVCRCARCSNSPLTRGTPPARLSVKTSTERALRKGCFAAQALAARQFIGEYVGELVAPEEAQRRARVYDSVLRQNYLSNFTSNVVIDAFWMGNELRFVNHSREKANCEPRTVFAQGAWRLVLFATRAIRAGEELWFDYGDDYDFHVATPPPAEDDAPAAAAGKWAAGEVLAVLAEGAGPGYWLGLVLACDPAQVLLQWLQRLTTISGAVVYRFVPLQDWVDLDTVAYGPVSLEEGPQGWGLPPAAERALTHHLQRLRPPS